MTAFYHDSRDIACRTPFGAVKAGIAVTLRAFTEARADVTLRLWLDNSREELLPMACAETDAGFVHEAKITADKPGLIWYHFIADGRVYAAPADNLGGKSEAPEGWETHSHQITVYEKGFVTPDWMPGAVVYQIFTDRFFDGENGRLLKSRNDIIIHKDKSEPPYQIPGTEPDTLMANDFYGGNLSGVIKKLPYIQKLGATVIYLNPIFKASSNHKYDVGDYLAVDPTFGDEETFVRLCAEAEKRGIRIILDGVFSHVGEDSLYFNKYGSYPGMGAYQGEGSPYYSWFTFYRYPDVYRCWWDIATLPQLNHGDPALRDFLVGDGDSVAARWLRLGAGGWRLDVADELPDEFIAAFRKRVKRENSRAAVIGEVWEDATNKVSYGSLRTYALGGGLDSAMNYPLREALIRFLLRMEDANTLMRRIDSLRENYPAPMFYSLMNVMGTHDRSRILNILGECDDQTLSREARRDVKMTAAQRRLGIKRLKLMVKAVCALPGMPTVYYGDEAGMEGMNDPLCRGYFPWGSSGKALTEYVAGQIGERERHPVLKTGHLRLYAPHPDVLVIHRWFDGRDALGKRRKAASRTVAINRGAPRMVEITLPGGKAVSLEV